MSYADGMARQLRVFGWGIGAFGGTRALWVGLTPAEAMISVAAPLSIIWFASWVWRQR